MARWNALPVSCTSIFARTLAETLAVKLPGADKKFIHMEDEISSMCAIIGASCIVTGPLLIMEDLLQFPLTGK